MHHLYHLSFSVAKKVKSEESPYKKERQGGSSTRQCFVAILQNIVISCSCSLT